MKQQLQDARQRVRAFERATERVSQLAAESKKLHERVEVMSERFRGEQKDVDRLEELSIQAIWHSLRGDKPEALAEEKRQLLYAKSKLDEAAARLAENEKQRAAMAEELEGLRDAREAYTRLVAAEERALREADGPQSERMRAIAAEEERLQDIVRQLGEAETAALAASGVLGEVQECLRAARGWGGMDMVGGGIITTALKHSRIDAARSNLARAQVKLRALQRELGDVGRVEEFAIDIGSFATFADYFFDGLMVDWFVQSRIHDASDQVSRTLAEVRRIASELRGQEKKVRVELGALAAERRGMVEGDEGPSTSAGETSAR